MCIWISTFFFQAAVNNFKEQETAMEDEEDSNMSE
jgi:hypothetical protein